MEPERLQAEGKKIFMWGRYEFTLLFWFFILWGAVFLDRLVINFLAPLVMKDLNITDPQYGMIATFTTGFYAVSAMVVTPLIEKTGKRKKYLIMLVFGAGIGAIVGSFTHDVWPLLATRAFVGFCEGPIAPIIFATLLRETPTKRTAVNSGVINMGVSAIAVTLGPILVTSIAAATSWREGFIVAGAISIVVGLILIRVVHEVEIPVEEATARKESTWKMLKKIVSVRNVMLAFFLCIVALMCYWTIMLYSTLFFTSVGNNIVQAGAIVTLMGVLAIVWTVFIPKTSDWLGRRGALIMWFGILAVGSFIMFGLPTTILAVIAYIIIGYIPGSCIPYFQAIIPGENLPNYLLATASGLIIGFGEIIGGAIWPAIAGFVAQANGYPFVIMIGGIFGAIACGLSFLLTKGKVVQLEGEKIGDKA